MSAPVSLRCTAVPAAATGAAVMLDRVGEVSDTETASFHAVRPRLFGIAYRMLRSAAEAEDVVQDTWIRWQGTDRSKVRDAATFLATTSARLAINVTQSARARRETHIGPWLPEPVDAGADPTLGAERRDALKLAVRMLLEKLSPAERAAFLLREAFDYPYRRISEVLALSETNARQLVTRARNHLSSEPRRRVSATEHQRLLTAFLAAAQTGDLAALERLLTADVVSHSDRGRVALSAPIPVVGRARAASLPVGAAA
jgi:RNA polymerase sigma-70 factor, ECF subfamily